MKSNTKWIIAAIGVVLLAVAAGALLLKTMAPKEDTKSNIEEGLPDMTEQEILDMMNEKLPDSMVNAINSSDDSVAVEPDSILEFLDDGSIVYLDENGEKKTISPKTTEMTPEEIDEYYDNLINNGGETAEQPKQPDQPKVIIPDDAGAYDEHFTEFNGVDEPTGENDPDYKKNSSDGGIETDWSLWDAEGEAPSSTAQSSYTIN